MRKHDAKLQPVMELLFENSAYLPKLK